MKTIIVVALFSCVYFFANAQSFAIINDKDGYVNIRENRSASSAVVGKILNDDVFDYDESDKSEWVRVYKQEIEDKSGGIAGFVLKGRIFPLSTFNTIKNIRYFKDSCIAKNDSLIVVIKSSLFNPKGTNYLTTTMRSKKLTTELFGVLMANCPRKSSHL